MHEGKRLRVLIKGSNETQEEIVARMGYSSTYIGQLYKQESIPDKVKEMACEVFGIGMEYFAENPAADFEVRERLDGIENEMNEIRDLTRKGAETAHILSRQLLKAEEERRAEEVLKAQLAEMLWELVFEQAEKERVDPGRYMQDHLEKNKISLEVRAMIFNLKPKNETI